MQAQRQVGVEKLGDPPFRRLDLLAEHVALLDEQPDLECHLLIQPGWRDGFLGQLLNASSLGFTQPPADARPNGIGQRADPPVASEGARRLLPFSCPPPTGPKPKGWPP